MPDSFIKILTIIATEKPPFQMHWTNCYSERRYGLEKGAKDARTESERDWDRIIFSSPFRRLQNKTQVFPLPEEIFVHNRLTHSLEVASVGRSLGTLIGKELIKLPEISHDENARWFYENNLKNVIAAACLAHDLGNPAFGHSGEEAISKYFRNRETNSPCDIAFKKLFSTHQWHDLTNFEGNANALRILTLQQHGRLKGGFRLTYSTLASIIKYPCASTASLGKKGPKHRQKYGFFKTEEKVFLEIAKELNMLEDKESDAPAYKRHPFVYLVEAADDICYNIIDLEDAHRLRILTFDEVSTMLMDLLKANPDEDMNRVQSVFKSLRADANEAIAYLRAKSINTLTQSCAKVFMQNHEAIISGTYQHALMDVIEMSKEPLKTIQKVSIDQIYNCREVVKIEIAGFRVMSGLVKDFTEAALTVSEKRTKEQKKLLKLLPVQYHFDEQAHAYEKVMHVIDFISGMTDIYAMKLYRNLRGIEA